MPQTLSTGLRPSHTARALRDVSVALHTALANHIHTFAERGPRYGAFAAPADMEDDPGIDPEMPTSPGSPDSPPASRSSTPVTQPQAANGQG